MEKVTWKATLLPGMREEYMNRKYPYLIGRYASAAEE